MTGAPASAYGDGEFLVIRLEAVRLLGSWESAGVWHRVVWRSRSDGSWTATIAQIADDVMLSEYRTKMALRTIRDAGWITTERASWHEATLRWVPLWDDGTPHLRVVESDGSVTEDFDAFSLEDVKTTTPPPNSPTNDDGLFVAPTALAVVEADPVDVAFEAFWTSYPRKVAKARARKAYATAGRSAAARAAIADGLAGQLAGLCSRPMDKIPHPTTWLNGRRWEDEPEHAAPMPSVSSGGRRNYFAEATLAGRGAELLASMSAGSTAIGGGA